MGLLILGTRSFAVEVADIAQQANGEAPAGFVENLDRDNCAEPMLGLPVTWIDDTGQLAEQHRAVCAIGSTQRRSVVEQAEAIGFKFAEVRHPSAIVSPTAELGEGCIVGARVVVAAAARIGRHVVLNRGALIGHHTQIGDFATLSPGANVAGCVTVGDQVYIGMGAIVLDHLTVGTGATIGAGAVVTRDVPAHTQVQGVPARVVKEGTEPK